MSLASFPAPLAAPPGPAPRHVAIIMDGNRRWAQARGLPVALGHKAGAEAARRREGQGVVVLDAKLGTEDVHGGGARGWGETTQRG